MRGDMRVLALGDYTNVRFHPFRGVDDRLQEILSRVGCDVVCTEDRDALLLENLSGYGVYVSYTDAGEQRFTAAQMAGLLQFIASGGGFVAIHAGLFGENMEYRHLVGARFVEHPPRQTLSIVVSDPNHPIMEGVSDFVIEDELYLFEFVQPNDLHVIAECQFEGKRYPNAWVRPFGLGRVAYLALGHSLESFQNEMFARMVANAVLWTGAARERPEHVLQ